MIALQEVGGEGLPAWRDGLHTPASARGLVKLFEPLYRKASHGRLASRLAADARRQLGGPHPELAAEVVG